MKIKVVRIRREVESFPLIISNGALVVDVRRVYGGITTERSYVARDYEAAWALAYIECRL